MNESISAYTPLRVPWPHALGEIAQGIRIVPAPAFDGIDWHGWNLRPSEIKSVITRSHWLRLDGECLLYEKEQALEELCFTLRKAMLGLQLWAPTGWDGLLIGVWQYKDRPRVQNVSLPEPYPTTSDAARLTRQANPHELPVMVEGTLTALASDSVRQINPFQFLEIGLQTAFNHDRAGALLCIIGLDALLGAEKRDVFKNRLIALLGENMLVFPEDHRGEQLTYRVKDLAEPIFEWRGLAAHGKEILEKYRKPDEARTFTRNVTYYGDSLWNADTVWTKERVYCEAARLLLVASLRKIILEGLLPTLSNKREWEKWLESVP